VKGRKKNPKIAYLDPTLLVLFDFLCAEHREIVVTPTWFSPACLLYAVFLFRVCVLLPVGGNRFFTINIYMYITNIIIFELVVLKIVKSIPFESTNWVVQVKIFR